MKKQIHLNGFTQNSVAPHSPGLWKHPKDQGHRHRDLDYWINLAKLLERGKFDAIFLADVLGIYDVYENSYKPAIRNAVQVPLHDTLLQISAMAAATKHLGFAATYSATYTQPYKLAREFSTLDHLSKGRVAWNIVTSYLKSEAINLGLEKQIEHDTRYDRADEYMDVVYKLWEKSWEDDAIKFDKKNGIYTDPEKVHPINHKGKYFNVPGVHLVDPSPQRTPVLFQAGASSRGRDFAAKHAEGIFTVTGNNIKELQRFSADIRERARKFGRDPYDIKIFPAIVPIVGSTEEEAKAKYEELLSFLSYEGTAALLSGHTGVDFSQYNPEEYVEDVITDASHGFLQKYTVESTSKRWTVREAVLHHGLGIGAMKLVGTPEQIADKLEKMSIEGDVDGFNIIQAASPVTLEEFVDHVVPVLQARGIYRKEYEANTLRENLFGKGNIHLPNRHPAKKVSISLQEAQSI
ncbi:LLM class flavin-dependent oxidoreductase [Caldibacillus thermolactis]|jgi:long-chain alkane monooxygenase|uniref:LLM class flavin-dependent oxidoreductase n=1 Tax=Pallidibacillus thermolactis TaxID=251051 RepID=A0ABT2WG77_9BACI|nr:LLM class flavin-dependent oxidoreductase [Pallidibacillus thermolactis]MCU9594476.1 LLM class flavin-dependent oxidoreductase [Pallidibacillus thermolactis]